MKHVLVTRVSGTANFHNNVFIDGHLIRKDIRGSLIDVLIPRIKSDIDSSNGNVSITISSIRDASKFPDPDNSCIEDGIIVLVLAPLADASGDVTQDSLRPWTVLSWNSPDRQPARGDKIRQKGLSIWLSDFFTSDQLAEWKSYNTSSRVEIWFRPEWNAARMFPELFPEINDQVRESIVNDVKDHEQPFTIIPLGNDGKPVVRVGFTPRTKWRFFGIDGNEVARNFPDIESARAAMIKYMHDNRFSQQETAV